MLGRWIILISIVVSLHQEWLCDTMHLPCLSCDLLSNMSNIKDLRNTSLVLQKRTRSPLTCWYLYRLFWTNCWMTRLSITLSSLGVSLLTFIICTSNFGWSLTVFSFEYVQGRYVVVSCSVVWLCLVWPTPWSFFLDD